MKADDIQALKSKFGFPPDQSFYVPKEVYDTYRAVALRGAQLEATWTTLLAEYAKACPQEFAELTRRITGKLPEGWEQRLPVYKPTDPAQASRKLSEIVLTALTPVLPELVGGSADLTGSNLTKVKGSVDFQPPSTGLGDYTGKYIRYGVREHGMGAIANGLSAYGSIIPYVGTFLVNAIYFLTIFSASHTNRTSYPMLLVPSGYRLSVSTRLSGSVSTAGIICTWYAPDHAFQEHMIPLVLERMVPPTNLLKPLHICAQFLILISGDQLTAMRLLLLISSRLKARKLLPLSPSPVRTFPILKVPPLNVLLVGAMFFTTWRVKT